MTEHEQDRRLTAVESRIDQIDQHGTRGMESVRTQVSGLERDLGKLESTAARIETSLQSTRDQVSQSLGAMQLAIAQLKPPRAWPSVARDIGMLLPLYALVADLIAKGHLPAPPRPNPCAWFGDIYGQSRHSGLWPCAALRATLRHDH